ncbi:MAG: DNA primase [Minisyncoccia bacterium]
MRGDVDTIKERLDIAEIVSGYVKLEKAGASFKGRCPFHQEKTPSFFVSPGRQSYYCFGCGAKGDIFTFVEEMEGLEFRGALKLLAEKAGVELEYKTSESKTEKDKILAVLEEATTFFEKELAANESAKGYVTSRGINNETTKIWRIGYAPAEWRSLLGHLQSLGYDKDIILKAGLIKLKEDGGEPYDVFRDRIIFPLADQNGRVIAFSGRALAKETEPKYLNSPETILFTKSEVLYGLDKAKDQIRRKDYAVLVEGQIDLVLSHQVGVDNTVATSGTAFTNLHLERLKRFSSRIIIAFDGDLAGEKAAEKASELGISLGLEVKVASMPEGEDPAEVAKRDPEEWKNTLRESLPAVEFFFKKIEKKEKDPRKLGKQIEKEILPLVKLLKSSIEQSHFISMIAKRTGIKEEIIWDDLSAIRIGGSASTGGGKNTREEIKIVRKHSRADEYREVTELLKENPGDEDLVKHSKELSILMRIDELDEEITLLRLNIDESDEKTLKKLGALTRERDEERRKML